MKNNRLVILSGLLASLFAMVPLMDLRNIFDIDWNNHLWLIEYFGESLKHGYIPVTLNTQQIVGMPITLFYAQKFYVLLGLFSSFLGSAITVRVMVLFVFLLQFYQVYRAAIKAGAFQNTAICIAVVVTWAIYPLTNLYNRSALTEFFAVAFLTCSLASFLCIILNSKDRISRFDLVSMGFYFVMAAVTHPLTSLFGGLFLAVLGIITLFFCERERRLWFLGYFSITALIVILILSPWLYILHLFKDKIYIGSSAFNQLFFLGRGFHPGSIDNILSRLSLCPLDWRSINDGVHVHVAYLDAQIMMPLVLLIGGLIYIRWQDKGPKSCLSIFERAIIAGVAVIFLLTLTVSVDPYISSWLGHFFDVLQFPYRLTSYMNLSILTVLIILSRLNVNDRQFMNVCLAFCIGISFSSLAMKLIHVSAITQKSTSINEGNWAPLPFGSKKHLNELPGTFYGAEVYSVVNGFSQDKLSGQVLVNFLNFNVLDGRRFGDVAPMAVTLTKPQFVLTNIQPFPWNQITVNGVPRLQSSIFVFNNRMAIFLPQGNYILSVETYSNKLWRALDLLSWVLLVGWIVLYLVMVFFKIIGNGKQTSLP